MKAEYSVIAILAVLLLSSVVFFGGLAFAPTLGDKSVNGDWYLTWSNGQNSSGEHVSDVFNTSAVLSMTEYTGSSVKGSIDGIEFTGTTDKDLVRFSLDMSDGRIAQMLGLLSTPDVLNVTAVVYDRNMGTSESYSLLFTRDSVLPHMIEEIQEKITGDWITGQIGGSGGIQNATMNVAAQDSSIAYGTINYDGSTTQFCLAISMIKNETMNAGLMVDDNGNFWMISLKKGLIAMYSANVSGGSISDSNIYLVRNAGDIFVSAPFTFNAGDVFHWDEGYDSDGMKILTDGYSLEITGQSDCMFSGKIIGGSEDCAFAGVFFVSSPSTAELMIMLEGAEIHASMFVDRESITIVAFEGGPLFENMTSMIFWK